MPRSTCIARAHVICSQDQRGIAPGRTTTRNSTSQVRRRTKRGGSMKMRLIRSALRICALAPLVLSTFRGSAAQPVTMDTGSAVPVRAQALDRTAVVAEIMTAWNDYRIPVNENNETPYGPFDLRAALKYATPEQLLDARRARTFDDLVQALPRTVEDAR